MPTPYLFTPFELKKRADSCSCCGLPTGHLVGRVDYFSLGDFDMIQCPECGLTSIDPIPTDRVVKEGCTRLYASGYGGESRATTLRGFAKSYRKGARFARRYLDPAKPLRVLEVGAGDGYFSAGVKAAIPGTRVWLLDVVEELVRYYEAHHECQALCGELETTDLEAGAFDLVVLRDLLEHVRRPFEFLTKAASLLAPGGMLFFITPNGREDFWMIHQRYAHGAGRSILLLNHFHYFLPETLDAMLARCGLVRREGFKFGLKQHRAGLGERTFTRFSKERVPDWNREGPSVAVRWRHDPKAVTGRWLSRGGWISRLYSGCVDREAQWVPFDSPIGHEFFVLAEKPGLT